jgi:hypothetical protein
LNAARVQHFTCERESHDAELEMFKNELARHMARRWQVQLGNDTPVKWTERITFEPDGVSVAVSDDPDDDLLLDWADVRLVNTKPGRFVLMSRSTGRQVKELATSADNFFPGFFLLEELRPADAG